MKTDLSLILSVSGQHGLYRFFAQARNGVIAEALDGGKRTTLSVTSKIIALSDIAIFTNEGELRLAEVFLAMKGVLGEEQAPCSKAADKDFVTLFKKAIPNYDEDRFYVSHMKKVSDWYNQILQFASFDFKTDEDKD